MKYIRQFTIILFISLAGEIIHLLVPLPVPASIYGLLIMLIGLRKKWIPLEAVEEVSIFLIDIMPLMFIPAAVGLLDSWGVLRPILVPFLVITLLSTIIVMVITGKVTQLFIKNNRNGKAEKNE
ncbi:MAG: CidA/LrgA family protein [Lacrimispora sphenoides]|jgi:holin-like protein|uniref:Holin-like protein n=1 Tax=Lacrimispora sphenoides JCM 1415 TaxID=1297793 RepID=A0ABY1C772_9FIRM|nr:CidA/LrgA family protein [Lacrimispora sphenoides]SET76386.1 holin-like protein [[Clostridium] sphenoides JCM 1415]SUY51083.1 LrgA family protein [Lacrimispora sphenoides]